ncbi:MAG: hypothetical protein CSB55_03255 [Candidatus Cloacimonadota bacterium]|nr:MAG: hypothetical protein CSB55_03255 [Candidatus Cloacimonadota bacterium]
MLIVILVKLSAISESLEMIPDDIEDTGLKYAYEDAERYTWTKEELLAYDQYYSKQRERKDQMEETERKGLQKRLEKAREEGEKKKALEIAKNLLKAGVDFDIIEKSAGL